MDFYKTHGARRKITKILEDRQKAEAKMFERIRGISVTYCKFQLDTVTEWLSSFRSYAQGSPDECALTCQFSEGTINLWIEHQQLLVSVARELALAEGEELTRDKNLKSAGGGNVARSFANLWADQATKDHVHSAASAFNIAKKRTEEVRQQRQRIINEMIKICEKFTRDALSNWDIVKRSTTIGDMLAEQERSVGIQVADILSKHRDEELVALSDVQKCLDCLRRRYSDLAQISTQIGLHDASRIE